MRTEDDLQTLKQHLQTSARNWKLGGPSRQRSEAFRQSWDQMDQRQQHWSIREPLQSWPASNWDWPQNKCLSEEARKSDGVTPPLSVGTDELVKDLMDPTLDMIVNMKYVEFEHLELRCRWIYDLPWMSVSEPVVQWFERTSSSLCVLTRQISVWTSRALRTTVRWWCWRWAMPTGRSRWARRRRRSRIRKRVFREPIKASRSCRSEVWSCQSKQLTWSLLLHFYTNQNWLTSLRSD